MYRRNLIFLIAGLLSIAPLSPTALAGPQPKKQVSNKKQVSPRTKMLIEYNAGVDLMLESKHFLAQTKFENALRYDSNFAEAHNNLAYVLRKQGEKYFKQALDHYNKAIELEPKMAQAYMYRGVLYIQMNKVDDAKKDLDTLYKLDPALAKELDHVLNTGKEKTPAQFFGVSKQVSR